MNEIVTQEVPLSEPPPRGPNPERGKGLGKTKIAELAALGGQPAFARTLHVGQPNIGCREAFTRRLESMFQSRRLTNNGPMVREFEQRIAELAGVKHCVAMCNATVALQIAIRALEFRGEVIVPSFTFVATAHALQWEEITPVFCDIDPVTHTLNPLKVEALITPRTTGIIGVHLWGRGCEVEQLSAIARKHGLKLAFDAAHAFGCSHQGRMIGGFGEAEVFSFHATKFLNTFEGGAVATNNDALAEKIRLMTNFGFAGLDHVIYIGSNGKMCEPSAAMGLTSLESIDQFIETNRRNHGVYQKELSGIPGVRVYEYDEKEKYNYQYVVLEIDAERSGLHRDLILEALCAENVLARRYFYPGVHRMEPYRSFFPHAGLLLPETEALVQRILILPTGTAVEQEDIRKICGIIRFCLENAAELEERLEKGGRRYTKDLR